MSNCVYFKRKALIKPALCSVLFFVFSQLNLDAGVIHLNENLSNSADFINSLFDPDVRDYNNFEDKIIGSNPQLTIEFSPSDNSKIIEDWMYIWENRESESSFSFYKTDINLIIFLRDFIKQNNLIMFVPQFTYYGETKNKPIYNLNSYKMYSLLQPDGSWNENNVQEFLKFFIVGAHFVVIDSSQDSVNINPRMIKAFGNNSVIKKDSAHTAFHSHYTSLADVKKERAYPDIRTDKAKPGSPFICSFLIGNTAWNYPNTFFQLEGWPCISAKQLIGGRHSSDYDFHKMTAWNISTYGACAYSEKRATAIFLAHEDWEPKVQSHTGMAPYRGADTPQGWLEKELIRVNGNPLADKL